MGGGFSIKFSHDYPKTCLDRDLSILSFNQRVLSLAEREDYPLLERLRFLCIVAANLDEFFEVRMAQQLQAVRDNVTQECGQHTKFVQISNKAHALVAQTISVV
jgi:polyphosphate kinase